LALYEGDTDTICLNPDFTGQTATEYGKRLVNNQKELEKIRKAQRARPVAGPERPVVANDEDWDEDVEDVF
jgi:hypothetical protein